MSEYAWDFVITVASILLCVLISIVARRNEKKTVDGFLLGDRNMSLIPVALSAFATIVSANNITTLVGETFANGMQFIIMPIAFFLIQLPIAFYIIPVFHNMQYTSVYEYIERRFDKSLRILFSVIYMLINLVLNAVFLYVPAITVTTVTGVSYWIMLVTAGLICSLYCVIGGLKAVIWTDVFQCALMFGSVIMVTIAAYVEVGGIGNAWHATFSGQVAQHFVVWEDTNNNYSVWNLFFYALTHCFYTTIGSQACAQRFLCVKDYKTARNAFILSNGLGVILNIIVFLTCVAVFGALTKCNPLDQPDSNVVLPDQIYIYVAAKLFKGIPGVLGIILAGLISAALSSVSSVINALAANSLEDYIMPLFPQLKEQERKRVILCRILTATFGILTVLIGLIVPEIGGVIHMVLLIAGALAGPLGGILVLAFFVRKTSIRAVKLSLLLTFVFSVWISIGSYYYYPHKPQFRHPVEQSCPEAYVDVVAFNQSATMATVLANVTNVEDTIVPMGIEEKGPAIYGVSAFWFPVMSVFFSATLALIFGLYFEPEKPMDVRLLSPIVLTEEEKKYIIKIKSGESDPLLEGSNKLKPQILPMNMKRNSTTFV